MAKKKDSKKKRRDNKKKKRAKIKSGQALLLDKIRKSGDFPEALIAVEPKGAEKMSEVILDFAEPLLAKCQDDKTERKAVGIAILVWNLSLLPKKEQKEGIQDIYSVYSKSYDATDRAIMMYIVDMLLERKKKHFPNHKRAIVEYQFSGSGKTRRLDVASTLAPR
jgi:hypothetical protein